MPETSHDKDVAFIKALAELLRENDLTELEVRRDYGEDDSLDVRVSRQQPAPAAFHAPAPPHTPQPPAAPAMPTHGLPWGLRKGDRCGGRGSVQASRCGEFAHGRHRLPVARARVRPLRADR